MDRSEQSGENSKPVAIFDSGIGGLTVLREALQQLPNENYIYFADTDHVPYGTRDKDDVRQLVLNAGAFLDSQGIKMLVVACNTATSSAIAELRNRYHFPVIGMEPAVKPAVSNHKNKRVLVLATGLTLKEQKFRDLVEKVDNEKIVDLLALPELVTSAERFEFSEEKIIPLLKEKFSGFNLDQYGTVVLGCTHYPFYKKILQRIFPPGTEIIDGNKGTVTHMKNILDQKALRNPQHGQGTIAFFHSGKKMLDQQLIRKYLDLVTTAD
jgi:glutamate racemase